MPLIQKLKSFGIRNPVDRAWSHLKLHFKQTGVDLNKSTFLDFSAFLHEDYVHSCGCYTEIIEKWRSVLPVKNIFLFEFKMLQTDPVLACHDIFQFLKISPHLTNLDKFILNKAVVNPTPVVRMPDDIAKMLRQQFQDEVQQLRQYYDIFIISNPSCDEKMDGSPIVIGHCICCRYPCGPRLVEL